MFCRIHLALLIATALSVCCIADTNEDYNAINEFVLSKFSEVGLTDEETADIVKIVHANGMQNLPKAEAEVMEYASRFPEEKREKLADSINRVKEEMDKLRTAFSQMFENIGKAFEKGAENEAAIAQDDSEEDDAENHEEL